MNENKKNPETKTADASTPTKHDKDIVDERNDAISSAYTALKSLGIPDEKIYDVLGIKVSNVEGGASVKASTSYKDTSEKNDSLDDLVLMDHVADSDLDPIDILGPIIGEEQRTVMNDDDIDDSSKGLFAQESNRLLRVMSICANFGKQPNTQLVKTAK